MRFSLLLLPLAAFALAGCVDVHEHPTPAAHETVVTPAPSAPVVQAPPGSTVVTRP